MRKEATIEQWKESYEVATRLKEMKPWEKFWDLDIIGIREGTEVSSDSNGNPFGGSSGIPSFAFTPITKYPPFIL